MSETVAVCWCHRRVQCVSAVTSMACTAPLTWKKIIIMRATCRVEATARRCAAVMDVITSTTLTVRQTTASNCTESGTGNGNESNILIFLLELPLLRAVGLGYSCFL